MIVPLNITSDLMIHIFKAIIPTFSESTKAKLPSESEILTKFIKPGADSIAWDELVSIDTKEDVYFDTIKHRVAAVSLVLADYNRDSECESLAIDNKAVWPHIYESIINLKPADIIATIGSQGFLSIPLFHSDDKNGHFEFLRLHIWDQSFAGYIDKEKTHMFSIHCHQFHAQSHILLGELKNCRFSVIESASPTDHSFFEIVWNSIEKVNQKTSNAINTGTFVLVNETAKEMYAANDQYEIEAGEFHTSTVSDDCTTATLFLFTGKKGKVERSYVVGPSEIENSIVNRKETIDPKDILIKINKKLSQNE
ncbi:hypothetical protein CLV42_1221 [Chitinophaga ginsengisoli]|uniref:Uncharacterized protein n=2 Tax=Chitinophaga ginsengisoli TaxID=363837 RepID=A0A2P8FL26_9BACT|nr:hypothetical protein CLV42_1221 [Chitinophaga ginsengisoli]